MNGHTTFLEDVKNHFRNGSMLTRLIFINVGIYFFFVLLYIALGLFQQNAFYDIIREGFALSSAPLDILVYPWTIISHMFTHDRLMHVLFNMLWLYWFGRIFQQFLGDKRILPLYLLGGLAGALLYVLAFNAFPVFWNTTGMAVGASAAVMAVVFATVTQAPNYTIHFIILGAVRLKYIALVVFALDLIRLSADLQAHGGNEGGYIAHIGGAIFGFLYTRQLNKGNDCTKPVNRFFDSVVTFFTNRGSRAKPKVVYKNTSTRQHRSAKKPNLDVDIQAKTDAILDKISAHGYDKLSAEEKAFLFSIKDK